MGREIKRVPLDFDWPIGKIWPGYMISLCLASDENCEQCKKFAKIINLPMTKSDCPELPMLEPPTGEGYQLWETTTEGSPQSPVFATPEELAQWLVDNNASTFGCQTTTYENWLKFIKGPGWAMTMVVDSGVMMSGVDYIAEKEESND